MASLASLVADINQATPGSNPRLFASAGGCFWFVDEAPGESPGLWRADPASGVVERVETAPGQGPWGPSELVAIGSTLFIRAYDASGWWSLFQVDASTPGATASLVPGTAGTDPSGLTALNGQLFFGAYATDAGGGWLGRELVKLDPPSGQITTYDLAPGGNDWSSPRALTPLNGRLFFLADDPGAGTELWGFDPLNDSAPQLLRDIYPGWNSSSISNLTASGGKLVFTASDGSSDEELWQSDGTPAGTQRLADINSNSYGSDPQRFVRSGGKLYFTAYTEASGYELYRADPASGTVQQLEIRPGPSDAYPGGNGGGFAELNGTLYFSAYADGSGWELWRVTPTGTPQRLDLGVYEAQPRELVVVGDTLYFSASGQKGRGIDLSRSFSLGGQAVTIGFDFLRLDSWDNETLNLYLDGQVIASIPFQVWTSGVNGASSGTSGPYGWSAEPISANENQGFAGFPDQVFRITLTIPAGRDSIALGLGSSLDSSIDDESYGIRNLEIRSAADPFQVLLQEPGTDPSLWSGGASASSPGFGASSFLGRYGAGSSPWVGRELWRIDNATGEPVAIDINPGAADSSPWSLQAAGGRLFFNAYTPGVGYELWTVNPADNIPHLVADLNPGDVSSRNQPYWWSAPEDNTVVAAAGRVYFSATTQQGRQLFVIQPGIDGAQLIDLQPGGSSSPTAFVALGDRLAFLAYDPQGRGLYLTDPATGQPQRLTIPGQGSANIDSLISAGGLLYFRSSSYNDDSVYRPLYSLDPASGTVSRVAGVSSVDNLSAVDGKIVFRAYSQTGQEGYDLFLLDPADPGQTPQALDINPGASWSDVRSLVSMGGSLYALAYARARTDLSRSFDLGGEAATLSFDVLRLDSWDGGEHLNLFLDGQQIFSAPFTYWGTDQILNGSSGGYDWIIAPSSPASNLAFAGWPDQIFRISITIPAGHASIRLGLNSSVDQDINDESYGIRNLQIVSAADPNKSLVDDPGNDPSLWSGGRLDNSSPLGPFLGRYANEAQWNLWRLDLQGQSVDLQPLLPQAGDLSGIRDLFVVGGTLYFSYDNGRKGRELWQSDGTAAGTHLAADINGHTFSSSPRQLTDVGGLLYFTADDGVQGRGLYRLTTSNGDLQRLAVPGLSGGREASIDSLVNANGRLYFRPSNHADDGTYRPLFTIDPASGAISRVAGVDNVDHLTYLQGQLLFSGNSPQGTELYRIADGQTTPQLIDVNPGWSSYPSDFTLAGGILYFTAQRDGIGRELFRLDAAGNAQPVKDILPGDGSSSPRSLFGVGSTLYFVANDGYHGDELWQSDGTASGTRLARDINNVTLDASPGILVDVGGILYFMASDATLGRGLYAIDPGSGTPQRLTVPGLSGGREANIDALVNANGRLYFRSNQYSDDGTYRPLFTIDPANGAISRVASVDNVDRLTYLQGQLLFAGNSPQGYELYRIANGQTTPQLIDVNPGWSSDPREFVLKDGSVYFTASRDWLGRGVFRLDGDKAVPVAVLNRYGDAQAQKLVSAAGSLYFLAYSTNQPAGPGQDVSRSFSLNGDATTIRFDLLRNDSWDGEPFTVYLDDQPLFFQPFTLYSGTDANSGSSNSISWTLTPSSNWEQLYFQGGSAFWTSSFANDQRFQVEIQIPAGRNVLKLGFGSSLNQPSGDESYAIDNLELRRSGDNSLITSDTFDSDSGWSGGLISVDPAAGSVLGPYGVPQGLSQNWTLWSIKPGSDAASPLAIPELTGDNRYYTDSLVSLGDRVFFRGSSYSDNYGTYLPLYTIDPLSGAVSQVAGVRNVESVCVAGGALYLRASYNNDQRQLLRVDGDANVSVLDLQGGYDPQWLTKVGNTLYFTAYVNSPTDGWLSRELWKIDPATGTPRYIDVQPGGSGSYPQQLVDVQGTLYFIAQATVNGIWTGSELYRIDPITDQVELLGDLYPGGNSSNPGQLTVSNGHLYFTATDPVHGNELWQVQLNASGSGIEVSRSVPEDGTLNFSAADFSTPFAAGGGGNLEELKILNLPLNGQLLFNGVPCTTNQVISAANLDQLSFVPNGDFNGTAAFNWSGSSGSGFSAQASLVTLTITPLPDAPRLQQPLSDRTIYSNRSDGYTFDLNTFRDPDVGQSLSYSATLADGSPLPNWITLNDRSFSFNPPPSAAGTYSIRVIASDPDGLSSLAAADPGSLFSLTVINAPPQSIGLTGSTIPENSPNGSVVAGISVSDLNTNDSQTLELLNSADGRFALSGSPATGYSLVVADASRLDYETATSHLIRLRTTDPTGQSLEQDFTIYLSNLADSPPGNLSFAAPAFSVREDGSAVVAVRVLRSGGVEGSVSATLKLTPGTASYTADYSAELIPVLFGPGQTEVTVPIPTLQDALTEGNETVNLALINPTGGAGLSGQTTAVLTIIDQPPNQAPVAGTDTATTSEDTLLSIPLTQLLANDTDPEADPLTINSLYTSIHGNAWLDGGNLNFYPDFNFNGAAQVIYLVYDGTTTSQGTLNITVNPVNDNPVAANDGGFITTAGTDLVIAKSTLLANDTDPDNNTLSLLSVQGGQHGTVLIDGDTIRFTPEIGHFGWASFQYTIDDGNGGSSSAFVDLSIQGGSFTDNDDGHVIYGSDEADTIDGAGGNDTIYGLGGADSLRGGAGKDYLFGNNGDDTADGGSGEDVVYDYEGTNSLSGGDDNDHLAGTGTLHGDAGDDEILVRQGKAYGDAGNDTVAGEWGDTTQSLYGGDGDDKLIGNGGGDYLDGGDGNDTLVGDSAADGNDTIIGGAGYDIVLYSGSLADYTITQDPVDPNKWTINDNRPGSPEGFDLLDSVELVVFDSGEDYELVSVPGQYIIGTEGDDSIPGAGEPQYANFNNIGDDTIDGRSGFDRLYGGRGDDLIYGRIGNDILHGGSSSDTLIGGSGDDTVLGDGGNDLIYGSAAPSFAGLPAELSDGNTDGQEDFDRDSLDGGGGNDTIHAGNGDDLITDSIGDNSLMGEEGDDTIIGSGTLLGGIGNDQLSSQTLTSVASGEEGDDAVYGYGRLEGGEGDDWLGVYANSTGIGGAGDDTLEGTSPWGIWWSGNETMFGERGNDLLRGNAGDDLLSGDSGSDTLEGGIGDDSLDGGGQEDTLTGGTGDDTLFGGEDYDVAVYSAARTLYSVVYDDSNPKETSFFVVNNRGDDGTDYVAQVENLRFTDLEFAISTLNTGRFFNGGPAADTLPGTAFDDIILGGADNDLLGGYVGAVLVEFGSASDGGNDIIGGQDGDDTIIGGAGFDVLYGDAGNDSISGDSGEDTVYGGTGDDTINGGTGDDSLYGGSGDDSISGDDGNDLIADSEGDNTLSGGLGNDDISGTGTLLGGAGDDTLSGILAWSLLLGEAGNDALVGQGSLDGGEGNDQITLTASGSQALGGDGNDTLYGGYYGWWWSSGNETLDGGDGQDVIYGLSGDDVLVGLAGKDSLDGGYGNDTLHGGSDYDKAYYSGHLPADVTPVWLGGNDYQIGGAVGDDYLITFKMIGGFISSAVTVQDLRPGSPEGTDTLDGIELLVFNDGDISLPLDANLGQTLNGSQFDDIIVGDSGNDLIDGLAGNDRLTGDDGNDTILGRNGNDVLYGDSGNDSLDGGAGDDHIYAGNGADVVFGGLGADTIESGQGPDTVHGDDGNDVIRDGNGANELYGDVGEDYIEAVGSLHGGLGQDSLIGSGELWGDEGNDYLDGRGAGDTLHGGDGADLLYGSWGGSGLLYGDDGNDTIGAGDNATAYGGVGDDVLYGWAPWWWVDGVQTLFGGTGNDTLDGRWGADSLDGGDGSDSLIGGEGHDTLIGGSDTDPGTDSATYGSVREYYSVIANPVGDYVVVANRSNEGTDLLRQIETLNFSLSNQPLNPATAGIMVFGTAADDNLSGTSRDDSIEGGDGNDSILGLAGHDQLHGGDGNDTIVAGDGYDMVYGELGNDSIFGDGGEDSIDGGTGNDTIFGGADNDTLLGQLGDDNLSGGDGDDNLQDGFGLNTLHGDEGNDVLSGTGFLYGDVGNDTLNGGYTTTVQAFGGTGDDAIYAYGELYGELGSDYLGAGDGSTARGGDGNDQLFGWAPYGWYDGQQSLYGEAGNDTISANSGDDYLDGGDGNDWLDGGWGNDFLIGGAGSDTFVGSQGDDTLRGDVTDVAIYSGNRNDFTIVEIKNSSNITTRVMVTDNRPGSPLGTDTILGIRTVKFDDADYKAEINPGILIQGTAGNDNISDHTAFDPLQPAPVAPVPPYTWPDAGAGDDTIDGYGGDDFLYGLAGADEIHGGDGNDTIWGGTEPDFITGDSGNDSIIGGDEDDFLLGNSGDDTLTGDDGQDRLDGGDGADRLYGGALNDTLIGGTGDDRLYGASGNDSLDGGDGNDTLMGEEGNDSIDGGDGNDVITDSFGVNTIDAGSGDDWIEATGKLGGGDGNDTFRGTSGNDTFSGDGGTDSVLYSDTRDFYTITKSNNPDDADAYFVVDNLGRTGTDYVRSVEWLVFAGVSIAPVGGDYMVGTSGPDVLIGTAVDDIINGLGDADSLNGLDGNDRLFGAGGNDTIHAGAGNDYVDAGSGSDQVFAGDGLDIILTGDGADMVDAGDGHDTIDSGFGDDWIDGGSGDDVIRSGNNNDWLIGNNGNDSLYGGQGNDTLDGGEGDDYLDDSQGGNILSGDIGDDILTGSGTLDGGIGNDSLTVYAGVGRGGDGQDALTAAGASVSIEGGLGDDILYGSGSADILLGNQDNDSIYGGGGNDSINAGTGNDLIHSGSGDDTIDGGDGIADVAVFAGLRSQYTITYNDKDPNHPFYYVIDNFPENGDQGSDQVFNVEALRFDDQVFIPSTFNTGRITTISQRGSVISGTASGDYLAGFGGADTLYGLEGDDTLIGRSGKDVLYGGSGDDYLEGNDDDDTLIGGAGSDILRGGLGTDRFRFEAASDGSDTIINFEPVDTIQLTSASFGLPSGALAAGQFSSQVGAVAATPGVRLIFDTSTSSLWWDPDGSGPMGSSQLASLPGLLSMSSSKITVV